MLPGITGIAGKAGGNGGGPIEEIYSNDNKTGTITFTDAAVGDVAVIFWSANSIMAEPTIDGTG